MNQTDHNDLALRQCLEDVGIGIWEYDHIHDRLSYSPALRQWIGGDFPSATGSGMADWLARIHPDDRPCVTAAVNDAVEKGLPFVVEYRFAKTDGEWLWLSARGQVQQRDAAGRPIRSLGSKANITSRKQEEALFKLQQRFNQVLIDIPDEARLIDAVLDAVLGLDQLDAGGVYALRPDGGYELVAARGIGLDFLSSTSDIPSDSPRAAIINRGEVVCSCLVATPGCTDEALIQQEHIRAEGITSLLVLPVKVNGKPQGSLNLASKHTASIPIAVKDFLVNLAIQYGQALERLHAKQEAIEQRRNLEGFFDALNDYVFILDHSGVIQHINPAVTRNLGYGQELIGQSVLAVHPPRVHEHAWQVVGEMLAGQRASCPLPLLRADGSEVMVDTRIVHGSWNGKPALLGISRDISELHAAQEELLKRDRYQRAVLDNFPFLVWLKDADSRFLAVNAPFARTCNQATPESFVGKSDLEIWPADLAERYRADDREVLDSGQAKSIEEQVETEGQQRWYETYKSPVTLDGKAIGTVGFARDITDKVSAREALEKALAELQHERGFLKTLIGTIPDLIWLKDPQGVYLACNPSFERFFGATEAEIAGKTDYDFVSAELADFFRANDLAASAVGHPRVNEEWVTFASDGHRALVETTKTPMYDDQGRLIGVLGIAHDITAARHAQTALQEANERRRLLMETSRDGIAIINQDHWIIEANPRFAEMLGYSEGELLGLRTWDYEANLSEADVRENFADLTKVNATFETRHRRKDGSLFDVEVSASGTDIGGIKVVITVCRDISERKRIEHALKASESALNQAQSVAHIGSWTLELGNMQLAWSDETYRIFGIEAGTPISLDGFIACIHPNDRDAVITAWQAALTHAIPYEIEHRILAGDNVSWVLERAEFQRNPAGEAVSAIGTVQDITSRKTAEQRLRDSEVRYRTVVDHMTDTLSIIDRDGTLIYVNAQAAHNLANLPPEQVQGRNVGEFMPAEQAETLLERYRRVIDTGEKFIGEIQIELLGQSRWFLNRLTPIRLHSQGVPLLMSMSLDISDRKRAEESLRDSEARYRVLADYSPDWDYWLGPDGRYHYVSPACERISGHPAQAFLDDPDLMIEVIHPDDRHHWLEHLSEAMSVSNQMHEQMVLRLRTHAGEERWIEHQCKPIHDAEGRFLGRRGINRDITLRHEAEEALRAREQIFSAIVGQAGDAIALLDGDTLRFIEFNDVACQGLGYSRAEFARLVVSDIQAEMDRERIQAVTDRLLSSGGGDFETRHRRKDGSLVDVRVSNRVVTIAGHKHLTSIWTDITDRKAKDRELEQHRLHLEELVAERTSELASATLAAETANKTKSAFLANMSHEIRTPMNAIIGLTHLLRRNNQDARQNERLDKVSDAAQHLLNIINDILDISKIEAGKLAIESTDFEPEKVLAHVVNLMGDKAAEKGLELVLSVEQLPAMLRGDPLRLGQILLNFVSNAIKFTKRGAIHISGRSVSENKRHVTVHFEVCDTGIGITEEQRNRLFKAFEQADSSTTRRFGGTGLGLVISKRLVELMSGRIGVESQPGIGSRFWIEVDLPRSRKQPKERHLVHDLRGTRALVVDDNEEAREVLANMLLNMGLRIETASDGHDALEHVQAADRAGAPFDLVLLDWHMPGLDGLETARRLRAMSLKTPPAHLMITAYGHRIPRQSLDQTGIEVVLNKPVTPSGLFDVLAEIFDGKQAASRRAPQTAHLEALRTRRGVRILLAEDNAINQEVALALLRDAGLHADLAENGAQAIELASNASYDLILMDVQMPVVDGLAATRSIHALSGYAEVPILAMTANAFAEDRQACLDAGMCDHVPKPVDPDVLYATLLKWLHPAEPVETPTETAPVRPKVEISRAEPLKPAAGELPTDIPGLDVGIGLKSLRGNVASYLSLLCKYAASHDDDMERLRLMRQNGDHSEARRIAHSLKGAAGALGAIEVQRLAADLETAIHHAVSEEAIQTLSQATEAAQRRLSQALRKRLICKPTSPPPSSEDALSAIHRLEALLRADDMAAQEAMRDAKPVLEPLLGASLLPICRDIEAFEYATALEKLQAAEQTLQNRRDP